MKTPVKPNAERSAATFGVTVDQAKVMFRKNAFGLLEMAERAVKTGRKVNGYTEAQLRASAADYLEASQ